MDFGFSEEQEMLRQSVRDFLQSECGIPYARKMMEDDRGYSEELWGKMADGINAVAWGNGLGARTGDPADGALQTALDRGWVVSATDYQPNDTYVVGRIAAADVIDAARATSQLMERTYGADVPKAYDTITWGHSQGGHAAIWAGQLMDAYQAAAPNPEAATMRLAGVAALAPASNFIVQPQRQGIEAGNGLADWEMQRSRR